MIALFFDTETTGLPNYKDLACQFSNPHVIQFAAQLVDTDTTRILATHSTLVAIDGEPQGEAFKVHGISGDAARKYGLAQNVAARLLMNLMNRADFVVCHNAKFDVAMARLEFKRANLGANIPPTFCTMEQLTPIMQLPGPRGHKWPKLSEAVRYAFDEELSGAHDALVDVVACRRLYFWMVEKGYVR